MITYCRLGYESITTIWDWVADLNQPPGFAGYTDWRIPEVEFDAFGYRVGQYELDSLIDLDQAEKPYVFDEFTGPCWPGCTVETCSCMAAPPGEGRRYWSSCTDATYSSTAGCVEFLRPSVEAIYKECPARVIAVRNGL